MGTLKNDTFWHFWQNRVFMVFLKWLFFMIFPCFYHRSQQPNSRKHRKTRKMVKIRKIHEKGSKKCQKKWYFLTFWLNFVAIQPLLFSNVAPQRHHNFDTVRYHTKNTEKPKNRWISWKPARNDLWEMQFCQEWHVVPRSQDFKTGKTLAYSLGQSVIFVIFSKKRSFSWKSGHFRVFSKNSKILRKGCHTAGF